MQLNNAFFLFFKVSILGENEVGVVSWGWFGRYYEVVGNINTDIHYEQLDLILCFFSVVCSVAF